MPNYSNNTIVIKGDEKKLLAFINEGLKNAGLETSNDLKEAYIRLFDNGKKVTLTTFRPMPETFREFDTTNDYNPELVEHIATNNKRSLCETIHPAYVDEMKGCTDKEKIKEVQERYRIDFENAKFAQRQMYGVVGWYDYNVNIALGTKWDTDFDTSSLGTSNNGQKMLTLTCSTAWSYPDCWLKYVAKAFDLMVFIFAIEESDDYHGCGYVKTNDYSEDCHIEWSDFTRNTEEPEDDDWDSFYEEIDSENIDYENKFLEAIGSDDDPENIGEWMS